MRIAFFDHPYHRATRSSQFFVDILSTLGGISTFYVEDNGAMEAGSAAFDEASFDLIVIWQVHQAFRQLSGRHPNVVFVPMYDAMQSQSGFYWKREFARARTVSFSRKLHEEVIKHGGQSHYVQFFPDPEQYRPITDYDGLRAFFWFRREPIDLQFLLGLIGPASIDLFSLHNAPDPGIKPLKVSAVPDNIRALEISTWTSDGDSYRKLLASHNLFFAPRVLEGIGMSFLEAMACGQCVVAPHASTMNEYIANGTNGILYPLDCPFPADFNRVREQGKRARESIERGHRRWLSQVEALTEFMLPAGARSHDKSRAAAPSISKARPDAPTISVVTVCLNAADDLEATILSVLSQQSENIEYLVLDGSSSDGSVEIIERHADRLAYWHSLKDDGVYHAMNDAVAKCSGDWIIFMNAGDTFVSSDAISRMFQSVPDDAQIVFGHHLYVTQTGAEQYHPAAEFETTWRRLSRGQLGFDWLSGIPGHQATAVRRRLLAELRFDTNYSIAADHDLLFRAREQGAQFFNCDEVISFYRAGGLSAKNYVRCKAEWHAIARKFGPKEDVDRFYAFLDNPKSASAIGTRSSSGAWAKISEAALFLIPGRRRAKLFESLATQGSTTTWPLYAAELQEGATFSRAGLPSFLVSMGGMAVPEAWGRWTLGPKVEFRFREMLPLNFRLVIDMFGSGQNIGAYAIARAGGAQARMRIGRPPAQIGSVLIKQKWQSDTLTLEIPHPCAPARLWPGKSDDMRELGIALASLKIIPADPQTNSIEQDNDMSLSRQISRRLKKAFESPWSALERQIADVAADQERMLHQVSLIREALSALSAEEAKRAEDQRLTRADISRLRQEISRHIEISERLNSSILGLQPVEAAMAEKLQTGDRHSYPPEEEDRSARGWIALGRKINASGQIEEALIAFARAAELSRAHPAAAAALIRILAERGYSAFASEMVIRLSDGPSFAAAGSALVASQFDCGQGFLAEALIAKLRGEKPALKETDLVEAVLLARSEKLDLAQELVGRVLAQDEDSVDAHRYAIFLGAERAKKAAIIRLEEAPQAKLCKIGEHSIVLPQDHPLDSYRKAWRRYSAALAPLVTAMQRKYPSLRVIDVGANVGDSAAIIRTVSNCDILCVEGHPAFTPFLRHNIAYLGNHIEIDEVFLGSASRNVDLSQMAAVSGTASLTASSPAAAAVYTGSVPLEPINLLLQRHPRFARSKLLKIDADGYDFDILIGAVGFLGQARPVLFFEYDPLIVNLPATTQQALTLLSQSGYSRFLVFDNFGNPFVRIISETDRRFAELDTYLESNKGFGTAVHYFDVCAIHDEDGDIFEDIAIATGFGRPVRDAVP